MKKYLKRIIFGVFFLVIIGWLFYLMINWVDIVKPQYVWQKYIIYIVLLLVFLYYLVFYVIKPTYIKWFKVINTCLGLFIITFSNIFLQNSWLDHVFYGDIITLIWVFLTIIWPTKALVSKELENSKNVEIIDV